MTRAERRYRRDVAALAATASAPKSLSLVRFGVKLARLFAMVRRVQVMPVRGMRVVRSLLVILRAMMLCGVAMVLRRRLVMVRRLLVVLGNLVCVFQGALLREKRTAPRTPALRDDSLALTPEMVFVVLSRFSTLTTEAAAQM